MIVTTSDHPNPESWALAERLAKQLALPFIPRHNASIDALKVKYQTQTLVVVTKQGPVVVTPAGKYFFHLNLAEIRIKNLRHGKHDHMVQALALKLGDSVLDCTLGLGSDAIVASLAVGQTGKVIGLEASPVLAVIAQLGLADFICADKILEQALRRIKVISTEALDYLKSLPDESMDVIYFDPMFRQPVAESSHLKPLRLLANNNALTPEVIQQAYRVARKRVVMKEKQGSSEFKRLGFSQFQGGKYSTIQFGIMDKGSVEP